MHRVILRPVTAPAPTMGFKGEYVVVVKVVGSGVDLRSSVKEVYEYLKRASISVFLIYDFLFQGLPTALEQPDEDTFENESCD